MLGKMETYWIYGHTINLIVLKVREIKYKKSYHEHIRLIKLDIKNWCLWEQTNLQVKTGQQISSMTTYMYV